MVQTSACPNNCASSISHPLCFLHSKHSKPDSSKQYSLRHSAGSRQIETNSSGLNSIFRQPASLLCHAWDSSLMIPMNPAAAAAADPHVVRTDCNRANTVFGREGGGAGKWPRSRRERGTIQMMALRYLRHVFQAKHLLLELPESKW
jgi:hypothetical protein